MVKNIVFIEHEELQDKLDYTGNYYNINMGRVMFMIADTETYCLYDELVNSEYEAFTIIRDCVKQSNLVKLDQLLKDKYGIKLKLNLKTKLNYSFYEAY